MRRLKLPPYITQSEIARACGWERHRLRRMLGHARVLVVPAGRINPLVSSELLRLHLPDVYEALLDGR